MMSHSSSSKNTKRNVNKKKKKAHYKRHLHIPSLEIILVYKLVKNTTFLINFVIVLIERLEEKKWNENDGLGILSRDIFILEKSLKEWMSRSRMQI